MIHSHREFAARAFLSLRALLVPSFLPSFASIVRVPALHSPFPFPRSRVAFAVPVPAFPRLRELEIRPPLRFRRVSSTSAPPSRRPSPERDGKTIASVSQGERARRRGLGDVLRGRYNLGDWIFG